MIVIEAWYLLGVSMFAKAIQLFEWLFISSEKY